MSKLTNNLMSERRPTGRRPDQIRPIKVTYDIFEYASGSVLYEIGKTKVMCAVTLQEGVPPFLRNTKTGWLSAEYSMLPTSTQTRSSREAVTGKRNGRSVEISRLISRALRTIVRLDLLGERTITIDCDVVQADGGTRTACITGASLALHAAMRTWLEQGIITQSILTDQIAAVSVGMVNQSLLLDIDFIEDSEGDSDFNFVLTRSGSLIEVQGTSEKKPMNWQQFEIARLLAIKGVNDIFTTVESMVLYEQNIPHNVSIAAQ
jgi:ribonuclease PH